MLSILQILKKYQEEKQKLKDGAGSGGAAAAPSDGIGPFPAPAAGPGDLSRQDSKQFSDNISIFSAVTKEIEDEKLIRVKEFYGLAFQWAVKIYSSELIPSAQLKTEFLPFAAQAVNVYSLNDKDFLHLCLCDYQRLEDYLFCHAVNTAFISLELGKGFNYSQEKLAELFCAAFFHDIGLVNLRDIVNKRARLTPDEFIVVKEHPSKGIEILNKMGGEFSPGMAEVIAQEHERVDGSGYPKGARDNQISEFSLIVAVADVYEALTHARPYRNRLSPPKAMNEILNLKNQFSVRVIKIMLERVGIFPVGTWVKLNTKETGIVVKVNQGLPLRPAVQVMFAENGAKLLGPKVVDLASNLLISVEECMECQYNQR